MTEGEAPIKLETAYPTMETLDRGQISEVMRAVGRVESRLGLDRRIGAVEAVAGHIFGGQTSFEEGLDLLENLSL